jgi:SAM-dependent methyltransferase
VEAGAEGGCRDAEGYEGIANLEAMAAARRYNRFLVDCAVRAGRGAEAVLDFGAGIGSLALPLAARGLRVVCVEPDAALRARLAAQGLQAEADLRQVADASFDLACAVNVLEHIPDDVATLRTLGTKLRPGGRLFVYVPAFQSLYSAMDRRVGHCRRYSRAGLQRACREAGLDIESIEFADSLGFFAALAYKWFGGGGGDLSAAGVRAYDQLVFPLSRGLDGLGLRRWFGKNLVVVGRRSGTRAREQPDGTDPAMRT